MINQANNFRKFLFFTYSIHGNHLGFGFLFFFVYSFWPLLLSCIYINGTEMRALNKTTVFSSLHFTRFHFRTMTRAGETGQGGNSPIAPPKFLLNFKQNMFHLKTFNELMTSNNQSWIYKSWNVFTKCSVCFDQNRFSFEIQNRQQNAAIS